MKYWDIFLEGYAATGERGGATHLATHEGETFEDAVTRYVLSLSKKQRELWRQDETGRWMWWGCRVFPTMREAKETFG